MAIFRNLQFESYPVGKIILVHTRRLDVEKLHVRLNEQQAEM